MSFNQLKYNILRDGSIFKMHKLYSFDSPSGKLVQIEYALAAVAAGGPSVGIKGMVKSFV